MAMRERNQSIVVPRSNVPIFCGGCGSQIQGDYLKALDRDWHRQCFSCASCYNPVTGTFFMVDGGRKCESCYNVSNCCNICRRPLVGPFVQYPDGREVHKECAPVKRCSKCYGDIQGDYTEVMGQEYHNNCFSCYVCTSPLGGKQFVNYDGGPHCVNCARNKGANIAY